MRTFVIFDRRTGDVVQTHMQRADIQEDPEELLKRARPGANVETFAVIEVEDLVPGAGHRVDAKERKLTDVAIDEVQGTGGAFVQPVGGDLATARTVVVSEKERDETYELDS